MGTRKQTKRPRVCDKKGYAIRACIEKISGCIVTMKMARGEQISAPEVSSMADQYAREIEAVCHASGRDKDPDAYAACFYLLTDEVCAGLLNNYVRTPLAEWSYYMMATSIANKYLRPQFIAVVPASSDSRKIPESSNKLPEEFEELQEEPPIGGQFSLDEYLSGETLGSSVYITAEEPTEW